MSNPSPRWGTVVFDPREYATTTTGNSFRGGNNRVACGCAYLKASPPPRRRLCFRCRSRRSGANRVATCRFGVVSLGEVSWRKNKRSSRAETCGVRITYTSIQQVVLSGASVVMSVRVRFTNMHCMGLYFCFWRVREMSRTTAGR